MKLLSRGWQLFLDILFPQICLHCKTHLADDLDKKRMLCSPCFSQIKLHNRCFYTNDGQIIIPLVREGHNVIWSVLKQVKYRRIRSALDIVEDLIKERVDDSPNLKRHLQMHERFVVDPKNEYLETLGESLDQLLQPSGEDKILLADEPTKGSMTVFSLLGIK